MKDEEKRRTVGSLFAGIGGFDLGFERAGWRTKWAVEINPTNRAVFGERFPGAELFEDVRAVGGRELGRVDCIVGGFPCQDISNMSAVRKGGVQGLRGARSGLFYEVLRIIDEIQPEWVVLENVAALLHCNNCEDIQTVISCLAERGYLGCFRVLDAQYFGVPQKRRRLFLVAGAGRTPPLELLADAGTVEALPCTAFPLGKPREADGWASNTVTATNAAGRINLGAEVLVAEEDGWGEMVERRRAVEVDGLHRGLDEANLAEAYAAGNAVVPAIAEWIAEKLMREF